ncbi:MAG: putative Ig domain-containing protein, partial [Vicinamibacterales bacterium]
MSYSRTLTACCAPNPLTWSVIGGALPSGFTLSPAGVLSGLTAAGATGPYTFLVKAADSGDPANYGVRQFTFSIVANAITTSTTLPTGKVGTGYGVTLTTLAGGGTWSLNAYNYLPPGLSLGLPNCSSGQICGTPTASGQYQFVLSNSTGPVSAVFTVQIYPATYNPPTFNLSNQTFSLGATVTTQLTASGGAGLAGGYLYSLSPGADPVPGLRIQSGAPLPTSFPAATTPATVGGLLGVPTQPGVWPTSIRVTDSGGNFFDRPITVTVPPIHITSQTTAPKAKWGQPYSLQLEAYGGVGYSWSMSGQSCGLSINSSGLISGTPTITGTAPCTSTTNVLSPVVTLSAGGYSLGVTLTLTVNAFDITTAGDLPDATQNASYSQSFASGCSGTCTWTSAAAGSTTIVSGGTGYHVGDVLTVSGGTGTAAKFNVTTVDAGGGITGVSLNTAGSYTARPSNPAATTVVPAPGTGATLNIAWTAAGVTFPGGLAFDAVSGVLSGTPTGTSSNSAFTLTMNQASPATAVSKLFVMRIGPASPQVLSITSPNTNSPVNSYFTIGSQVTQQLVASGGVPGFLWSIVGGALPPGLALSSDLLGNPKTGETIGANLQPGFRYIVGRPLQVGTYTFTLQAMDHSGGPDAVVATRTYTWTISELNAQYLRLPPPAGNITAGNAFSTGACPGVSCPGQLLVIGGSASEGVGNYAWANLTTLPYGLSLNASTGVISGTPLEVINASVPIQATDNVSGSSLVFNVTLNVTGGASPISIGQGSSLGTIAQGNTISTALNISGGTAPYTVTGVNLPSWLTVNSGSGLLQGQSGFVLSGVGVQAGTFAFSITVQDSGGQQVVRNFTLTVAGVTLAAAATLPDGAVGELYDARLTTLGGPVQWALAPGFSLPPGLALANIAGVYHLTGTPTVASTSYSFQLSGTDAGGRVFTGTWTLRIGSVRILGPQLISTPAIVGSPFSYPFEKSCVGNCVTWFVAGVPAGFNVSPDGLLTSTSVPSSGTFQVVVTATPVGGGVSVQRRFVLFARWPNALLLDFSLAATQLADATVGQPTNQALNPTGGIPPYSWSVAPGHQLPAGVALTDWSTQGSPVPTTTGPGGVLGLQPVSWTLSGVPTTAGVQTFDLILSDTAGSLLRRTFTMNVSPLGIVQGTLKAGIVNASYNQQFVPFGGTGTATFTMSPNGGFADMLPPGLTMNPSGLITGTPTSTGSYTFFLSVTQGAATFTRRTTLNVARAADTANTNRNLMVSNGANPQDLPMGVGRRPSTFNLAVSTLNVANGGLTPLNAEAYTWSAALKAGETFPP